LATLSSLHAGILGFSILNSTALRCSCPGFMGRSLMLNVQYQYSWQLRDTGRSPFRRGLTESKLTWLARCGYATRGCRRT
jgi:hypothetical protein